MSMSIHSNRPWLVAIALFVPTAALTSAGCLRREPVPATHVVVRTLSQTGTPVVGSGIYAGATLVARSDGDGRAWLDVHGDEGDTFEIRVRCPTGFDSPEEGVTLRNIRVLSPAGASPEYTVTCHETRHALVVAVRADGGPNLPVLYLGKEVARTDASGAAHVSFDLDVHDRVEVTIGTSGEESAGLHPQNPASIFEMPDHDDVQVFAVTFTRDQKKAPPARAPQRPQAF